MKEAYALRGMTQETIKISTASLTDSSLRQYNVALKKWWHFCQLTGVEIFRVQISDVLKFLTSEFNKGASHGSINSIRSAVSLF